LASGCIFSSISAQLAICTLPKLRAIMYCSADPCATGGRQGSDLVYVGGGQGEFAVEPAMKYVGYGGDYAVRRPRNLCCLVVGAALSTLLLTLGLICYLLWPTPDECLLQKETYQFHWSLDKTTRCCARGFIACPQQRVAVVAAARGPVDPFNCADGKANWQGEWSTGKKQWCCNQHGQGCGHDAEVPAAQYDCNSAFANWVKGWSEGKKGWCCSHGVKCCPSDAAAAGSGYGAGTAHGADFNGAPVATIGDVPFAQASSR